MSYHSQPATELYLKKLENPQTESCGEYELYDNDWLRFSEANTLPSETVQAYLNQCHKEETVNDLVYDYEKTKQDPLF